VCSLALLVLAACGAPPISDIGAIQTAAAQTVIAQVSAQPTPGAPPAPQSPQPQDGGTPGQPLPKGTLAPGQMPPPPPECVGKQETDANLPEPCKIYFQILKNPPQGGTRQPPGQPGTPPVMTAPPSAGIPRGIPWPMFHGTAQHTGQSVYNGPHTATLKWKYKYRGASGKTGGFPNNFAIDSRGRLYVNANARLLVFDPQGNIVWSAELSGGGAVALSADESVVYAVGLNKLFAYTSSGKRLWTFESPTRHNLHGEPTVAQDGTIYVGSWDTNVYALNPDGTLKWAFPTDGSIAPLASPTLSLDEKTIYVGSGDPNFDPGGTLYALSADGRERWHVRLDGNRVSGVVVAADGTLFANGMSRVFHLGSDGSIIWQSQDGTASSLAPSLSKNGIVYVGRGPDGKFFALDASSGQTLWSFQTGVNPAYDPNNPKAPPYGVPTTPTIGADGVVYFGAMDGVFYALNPDGTLLWSFQTGDNIDENGPALGPDGTLYFSSADGFIYAIKDK